MHEVFMCEVYLASRFIPQNILIRFFCVLLISHELKEKSQSGTRLENIVLAADLGEGCERDINVFI
jgi:hypothetical protein